MKTAFTILPETKTDARYHLLIEAGRDCVALLWYSKENIRLEGFVVYLPEDGSSDETIISALQKTLATENIPGYESCRIFLNYKESVLVPAGMANYEQKHGLLDLMYGWDAHARVQEEPVDSIGAINLYRAPTALLQSLGDRFYGAPVKHSNSCQVASGHECDLYCIIYPGTVKIILYKEVQFQMVQSYDYKSPADVSYYLLQVCQQQQLEASTTRLSLAGFIDRDSQLFQEIYRYFLHVDMFPLPEDVTLSEAMTALPTQFYSFLIPLLKCAS